MTGFSNSGYCRIFTRGDTVLTSYISGMPLELFKNINNIDDYNAVSSQHQDYYLQFFINGKKQARDLELPKRFPLVSLFSNGQIILSELE
jgi:hypothetical protein